MKQVVVGLSLVFFSLVFSSCSLSNSSPTDIPQEDITGLGLEVDFSVDSKSEGQKIVYELQLKNSGKEIITLTKDNFKLTTLQNPSPLTQDSINQFYDSLFGDSGQIILAQNQKTSLYKGYFLISQEYFKDKTKEQISLTLSFETKYKTTITNNVKLDIDSLSFSLEDSISQAAPLQVSSLDMDLFSSGESLIKFTLSNKLTSDESYIYVESYTLSLGSQLLTDCKFFYSNNGALIEKEISDFVLSSQQRDIELQCKFDATKFTGGPLLTQLQGTLDYSYILRENSVVFLPDKRVLSTNW